MHIKISYRPTQMSPKRQGQLPQKSEHMRMVGNKEEEIPHLKENQELATESVYNKNQY